MVANETTDATGRFGIVGLGGMGGVHSRALSELGHEVVAGADVAPDVRERFADRFEVGTYEDHESMYDREDLDGVVVTTPNRFHEPAAVAALERDLPVMVEKPPAHSLAAAERMVAAEADSGAFGMVGFQSRFSPAAQLFKAYDERGVFGDLRHVESRGIRRRGIPGLGSWFTDEELSGGGAVIDIGVHSLDLVLYLLDFPALEEVTATTRTDFGDRADYSDPDGWGGHWETSGDTFDVEDSASAFIRCGDGTTISFEIAWAANRKSPENTPIVWGTEAGAAFGEGDTDLEIHGAETAGTDHYVDRELEAGEDRDGNVLKDEAFAETALCDGEPHINTFEQGLEVQRLIDAIYRSSEQGRAIRLD